MKKILYFFLLCLYVLGVFGGIGYALYEDSYPIALGIVVLAFMAFPTAKKWWKILEDE